MPNDLRGLAAREAGDHKPGDLLYERRKVIISMIYRKLNMIDPQIFEAMAQATTKDLSGQSSDAQTGRTTRRMVYAMVEARTLHLAEPERPITIVVKSGLPAMTKEHVVRTRKAIELMGWDNIMVSSARELGFFVASTKAVWLLDHD